MSYTNIVHSSKLNHIKKHSTDLLVSLD
jgi:hypothetical protein